MTAEDQIAQRQSARRLFPTGNPSDSSAGGGANVTCALSNGCSIVQSVAATTTTEGTDCSMFFYEIGPIAIPERDGNHQKTMRAKFVPSGGVPESLVSGLAVGWVHAAAVVTGTIPLTYHQAIKLPEYIPFVILRHPPGGASYSEWTKGSTTSISISVAHTNGGSEAIKIGANIGLDTDFEQEGAGCVGFGAMFCMGGGTTTMNAKVEGDLNSEADKESKHAINRGNKVSMKSGIELTTDGHFEGAAGDLFMTPSMALRTLTVLPISFDAAACAGVAEVQETEWEMLDGSTEGTELYGALSDYVETAEVMDTFDGASSSKEEMAGIVGQASNSDAWNAVAVHTLYDVLMLRIPQLQERCLEDYCGGAAATVASSGQGSWGGEYSFWPSVSSMAVVRALPTEASVEALCGTTSDDCSGYTVDPTEDETSQDNRVMRMLASYEGIKGWKRTVELNDHLKARALASNKAKGAQLFATSLLTGQGVAFTTPVDEEAFSTLDFAYDRAKMDEKNRKAVNAAMTGPFSGLDISTNKLLDDHFDDFAKVDRLGSMQRLSGAGSFLNDNIPDAGMRDGLDSAAGAAKELGRVASEESKLTTALASATDGASASSSISAVMHGGDQVLQGFAAPENYIGLGAAAAGSHGVGTGVSQAKILSESLYGSASKAGASKFAADETYAALDPAMHPEGYAANADASVVAFSGGGGDMHFEYSSSTSAHLSLTFSRAAEWEPASGGIEVEMNLFALTTGFSFNVAPKLSLEIETEDEVEQETETTCNVLFGDTSIASVLLSGAIIIATTPSDSAVEI